MVWCAVIDIGKKIAEKCVAPVLELIKTEVGHLLSYSTNLHKLREEVENLSDESESVKRRIEAARNRGETLVEPPVDRWLERVTTLTKDASKIIQDEERETGRCLLGLRPNLWTCYRASKSAKQVADGSVKLRDDVSRFDRVASIDISQCIGVRPISDFQQFESRTSVSDQIVAALKDPSVDMVGVYGMGGMGKTQLVKKVSAQLQQDRTFNFVVMAVVSEKPDLKRIQGEIAEQLKIKLDAETESGRAAQLMEVLEKKEKILIILDNIWSRIEMEDIGIPFAGKNGVEALKEEVSIPFGSRIQKSQLAELADDEDGKATASSDSWLHNQGEVEDDKKVRISYKCKILMTSRNKKVLSNEMGSIRNFPVQVLSKEDASNLFEKMGGGVPKDDSIWESIAAQIVSRCSGIPILLVTVARALKDSDLQTWKDALQRLKRFDKDKLVNKAYLGMELSYDTLEGEEIKSLFLLCGYMSPLSISIKDLLNYTMGLGLFRGCDTLEEVRNRLHKCINDLKAFCLLQDDDNKVNSVQMHDVVRKFAISVATRDNHLFTLPEELTELKEWPDKYELESVTTISLHKHKLPDQFPVIFEAPKLVSFLLSSKDSSQEISDNFFANMQALKLMDLTGMSLSPLPSSLKNLERIQTLCLDHCGLSDIAILGELPSLRVLSLIGSTLVELPYEIGKLVRLQLLDLCNCSRLKVIAPGVLSELTMLEELCMENSFNQWEEEGNQSEIKKASLSELKNLTNLINLDLHIPNANKFPKDLVFEKLERFRIFIGEKWDWSGEYKTSKTLKLKLNGGVLQLDGGIRELMGRAEDLYLQELKGFECILYGFDWQGFPELKHLQVHNGPELQYIVNSSLSSCTAFPKLESLVLENLRKLEKISSGQLPMDSLRNLRIINVKRCDELNDLFSSCLARNLSYLREIGVVDCKKMQTIVTDEESEKIVDYQDDDDQEIEFTELRTLTLEDLQHLTSFYSEMKPIIISSPVTRQRQCLVPGEGSNEIVELNEVRTPTTLLNKKIVFPNLEELKLLRIKVGKIWDDELVAQRSYCFRNITSIMLESCCNIRYLFTSSMVRSLAQLKKIEVSDCKSMEEIVSTTGEIMGEMLFPHLNFIKLKSLPKLKTFCTANYIECPSLQQLLIEDCPELKTFATNYASTDTTLFDGKVAFPNLEELTLQKNMDGLKKIWGNELYPNSFFKLKTLKIEDGRALLYVFPPDMWRTALVSLQTLVVSRCNLLQEVFHVQMSMTEREAHMWNKGNLKSLRLVRVNYCDNLKTLFPASIALGLQLLEHLEIESCKGMEEIVSLDFQENGEATLKRFVFEFPKVTYLKFWRLPELKRFYPGSYISEWPILKDLNIYDCDKIDIIGPKSHSIQTHAHRESQVDLRLHHQSFLSFSKIVHNLETLCLRSKDIEVICDQGSFMANKLKILEIKCFHDSSKVLPLAFIRRFPNLEKLVVACSHFKQLFPYELLGDETNAKTLAQTPQLRLDYLPVMTHIWNEESQLDQILQNLGRLEVWSCAHLINLAPPTALFQNLTYLDVWKCNGLIKLVASSTAKSLVQLTKMRIRECNSLVEIVANGKDENNEDIVFEKMETVTLQSLTSLTSFCSATCNFKFPSLVSIIVAECPKMELFSKGVLSTPKLRRVWVKREGEKETEGRWVGNLNSTIQQLYKEMDGFCSLQQLKLSEFPELKNTWLGKLPVAHFSDLKLLEISECTFASYAISSSMLLSLNNLEELQVTKCNSLEEIFDISEELRNRYASENVRPLSELKKFYLADLSRLRHVWPENLEGILEFKNLRLLNICNCSSLRYVFTPSMILCLVQLQEIVVKNCACVEEIILKGEKEEGIGNDSVLIFPQLNTLLLQSLPCLASFYSRNGVLECPCLETITIVDCPKLETFTSTLLMQQELTTTEDNGETFGNKSLHTLTKPLFNDKVAFPNLEELTLEKNMDGLKKIWGDELHPNSFSKLKTLKIEDGSALLNVFPPSMLRRGLLNLQNFVISRCSSLEEVFDVQMLINEREEHVVLTPTQLTSITIRELPKLKLVWNEDPGGLLSFQNLQLVNVSQCINLKSLFPVSVALNLQQLEKLEIDSCKGMKELVSMDDKYDRKTVLRFLFPKVTFFKLRSLPELERFYQGSHSSEWPILKTFWMYDCEKVDMRGPEFESIQADARRESQVDLQLRHQQFLSLSKVIVNLEEVSLRSKDIEVVCYPSMLMADKLKLLELKCFHDSSKVLPVALIERFPNLEKLVVACSHFKKLFPHELLSDDSNVKTLARIPQLKLDNLLEMKHVWSEKSQSDHILQNLERLEFWSCPQLISLAPSAALFHKLTYLDVYKCGQLEKLLTSSISKSLVQLTKMRIRECDLLTEIVASDGEKASNEDIAFNNLESLTLQSLTSLASFCSATYNFKFPSLVSVIVAECPQMEFFSQGSLTSPKLRRVWVKKEGEKEKEGRWMGDLNSTVRWLYKEMVGYLSKQQLKLSEFPGLKFIWLDEFSVVQSSDIRFLEVDKCNFLPYSISSSMLLSLNNLEELRVTNCNNLQEVFDGSKESVLRNNNVGQNVGLLSKLKKFYLVDLPSLEHVWPENFEGILNFKNLTLLNVHSCNSLRYILTPSMALCLIQLKEIEVKSCARVEEIILKGENDGIGDDGVITFPQLNSLLLQCLPCLASFYSGNSVLECPSLEKITMVDCPMMETFVAMSLREKELTIQENDERLGNGGLLSVEALFSDKVAFPNLEELKFVEMDGLKMIWQNELHPSSFFKLKTLKIEKASTLLTIFPPEMVRRAMNLESLTISKCKSVQEVFDVTMQINESDTHGDVSPTQLKRVDISELPKLIHVWNKDPHGLLSFQNLHYVNASQCPTLKCIFPLSVALSLQKLEELKIENCKEMEEIVSKEEESQEESCAPRFVFPKVTYLRLWNLQALTRFYPGSYSSDWPMLSKLSVFSCDKFDIFGPKLEIIQDEACREEQRDIQVHGQPFLSFTKVIPNLEEVSIRSEDLDVISDQGMFTANKLKLLELKCFHDSSQVFPVSFLQRFPNLEKLVVACSHFKQLFPYELMGDETNAKTLARISQLRLDVLHEMTHIWDKNSQTDDLPQNLQRLEVWSCHRLINLAPSTAMFQNLTYLDVWKCNQLIKLMASSTAKSLVQLTKMRIRECNSLSEILANDKDTATNEDIVFDKLERLTLQSLTSLTSFCSAACNFQFPSLVSAIVAECPKMEFFSQGVLNTPKLSKVWVKKEGVKEEKGRWLGDLNSTVQQLYKEMAILKVASQQQLTLSKYPELRDIWLDKLSTEHFKNLKFLEVDECPFVSYAISSSLLMSVKYLEELQVKNCNSLEEVFDGSEELELRSCKAGENTGLLSELKKFYMVDLPSLRHVWPENLEGIFNFKNLTLLSICNCSSLKYILTSSMAWCLVQLQEIEVRNCARVEEIIVNGEKEDGIRDDSVMEFPQLNSLLLQSLPCLTSFYSGNGFLKCSYLKKITMVGCPRMKTFVATLFRKKELKLVNRGHQVKALFNDKVAFPILEELKIVEMDGLEMIWQNELHPSSFFNLKTLKIEKAHTLLTIFPPAMVRRALNLENLTISNCESVEEVFDVQMLITESDIHGEVPPTQLRSVDISKLSKLKHVWNRDPHGLLSYQNLCSVNASLCPTLKSLFPVSIALTLQRLEELKIANCKGMEEIVSKEEDDQEQSCDAKFVFPKVTYLKLWNLHGLKTFYPGSYTSEWPKLTKLNVYSCDKFDIFGPEFQSIQDHRHPFLSFRKVIPNLEEVSLKSKDIEVIRDQGLFTANKLKLLELKCFHDGSQAIPVVFLERFPNLEKLTVACSHFKKLFPNELVADETNAKTLARISQLRLDLLHEMTHIWDANSQLDVLLHDLGRLEVWSCHHLINLAPSTALFENLTYLDVWQCNGLITLLASSTAKSLVQLKKMRIRDCNSLVEIVANEEGEARIEDIVYEKLERLTLQSLASLYSFCSATCNFKFPSLVSVIMAECPKMEFFTQEVLSAPKLKKVWVKKEGEEEDEGRWMGNLNSTISQLYTEMNSSLF